MDLVSSHLQSPPIDITTHTPSPPHILTIRTLASIVPGSPHSLPPTPDYLSLPTASPLQAYVQYIENTSHDNRVTMHQPTISKVFTPTQPLHPSTLHTPIIKALSTSSPNPSFLDNSCFTDSIGFCVQCDEYGGRNKMLQL